jgi:epoxyqueuosine reductase QueG
MQPSAGATPAVSLVDWLERDGAELAAELDRLYVPRNDPRWLRRNALIAVGNTGTAGTAAVAAAARYLDCGDAVLEEAATWALAHVEERST